MTGRYERIGADLDASKSAADDRKVYRYMVQERGKRTGIVVDRQTGKEVSPLLSLASARALVYELNHGGESKAATQQVLRALDLKRQGYSHGAIARMLGISVADARRLV